MKLETRDIPNFLSAPAPACIGVLLYGPDGGLVRERAEALCKAWKIDPSDPFNVIELTEAALMEDEARLADELAAMSLMGGRRLVRVRDAGDKLAPLVESALTLAQGDNLLLVLADELQSRSPLRSLFEKEKRLAALPCYKDEGRNLEAVIRSALQGYGIQFDIDVLRYLTAQLGNDRGVTQSELEKISLYMIGETRLTLPVAMQLVGANDDLSSDDLAHAVAEGDMAALEDTLARLLAEGAQPVMLLRSLSRHFQKLLTMRQAMDGGKSADQAVESFRPPLFFREKPRLKEEVKRWTTPALLRAQSRLLAAEREVKSGQLAPELVTSHALFALAQAA